MPATAAILKGLHRGYHLSREASTHLDENQEKVAEIASFLSDTGVYQKAVEKSREMNKEAAKPDSITEKAFRKALESQIDWLGNQEEAIDRTHDVLADEEKVAEYGARIVDILSKGEGTLSQQLENVDQERQKAEEKSDQELLKKAFSDELEEMKEANKEAELAVEAVSLMLRLSEQIETLSEEEKKEMDIKEEDHSTIELLEKMEGGHDVDPEIIEKIEQMESEEENIVQQDEEELEEIIQMEAENISDLENEIDILIEDLNNTLTEMNALEDDIQSASFNFPDLEEQLQESKNIAEENINKLEECKERISRIKSNIDQSREALP